MTAVKKIPIHKIVHPTISISRDKWVIEKHEFLIETQLWKK